MKNLSRLIMNPTLKISEVKLKANRTDKIYSDLSALQLQDKHSDHMKQMHNHFAQLIKRHFILCIQNKDL